MSKTCEDCGNATCVCEGIGKMLTEAKCGTCGRDMNDAYNRLLCREHFTASIAALTSELAEARRQLGEVTRERDALKACRHVGPWIEDRGTWRRVRTIGEAGAVYHAGWITQTMDGKAWNVASDGLVLARRVALDAAKAAADAHLIAAGWFLAGGPHGAGEAK